MRRISLSWSLLCVMLSAANRPALAQFGPAEPQGYGPKLPPATAFPTPGTYPTTESVALLNAEPGTTIRYTWDGSAPTSKSPVYDRSRCCSWAVSTRETTA